MFRSNPNRSPGRNILLQTVILTILGAIAGTAFFFSPVGQKLEEGIGLPLLFKLRGPLIPPEEVVIVSLDQESATHLGFSENFSKWPRSAHAELVKKLHNFGAAVIAFDVHFAESGDSAEDETFADAIRKAGNVILYEKLRRQTLYKGEGAGNLDSVEVDIHLPPVPHLSEAALAIAPFPLPKKPVRISQAWLFKGSAGDAPTFPAVALQVMALNTYDQLVLLLQRSRVEVEDRLPSTSDQIVPFGGLVKTIQITRELFQEQPFSIPYLLSKLAENNDSSLSSSELQMLQALVSMYAGDSSIYINFYGPPETFPTISYHEIVSPADGSSASIAQQIRGKAVFVGAARQPSSDQKDGFYTVYSQPDGLDLNGVEIAATVFANLLEDSSITILSPSQSLVLLSGCAAVLALMATLLAPVTSIVIIVLASVAYMFAARALFSGNGLWIPVMTSAVVLPAAVLFVSLMYRYLRARRERAHIRKALGLYLPEQVVGELSRDLSYVQKGDRMVYSACLMTDAENYTTLSEIISPQELAEHMNEYFQHLFKPVHDCKGEVCNVIGDCMLALWPSTEPQVAHRENACRAALQILESIEQFNQKYPERPLPTRIGLHFGQMLMGNVGAEGHFEYAPVGDIVNATQRVEALNKKLGTKLLASDELIEGTTGVLSRNVGTFLLAGKSQPLTIHELLIPDEETSRNHQLYFEMFPEALELFMLEEWEKALRMFQRCLESNAVDGPSQFYLQMCASYRSAPPVDWHGVISVTK